MELGFSSRVMVQCVNAVMSEVPLTQFYFYSQEPWHDSPWDNLCAYNVIVGLLHQSMHFALCLLLYSMPIQINELWILNLSNDPIICNSLLFCWLHSILGGVYGGLAIITVEMRAGLVELSLSVLSGRRVQSSWKGEPRKVFPPTHPQKPNVLFLGLILSRRLHRKQSHLLGVWFQTQCFLQLTLPKLKILDISFHSPVRYAPIGQYLPTLTYEDGVARWKLQFT